MFSSQLCCWLMRSIDEPKSPPGSVRQVAKGHKKPKTVLHQCLAAREERRQQRIASTAKNLIIFAPLKIDLIKLYIELETSFKSDRGRLGWGNRSSAISMYWRHRIAEPHTHVSVSFLTSLLFFFFYLLLPMCLSLLRANQIVCEFLYRRTYGAGIQMTMPKLPPCIIYSNNNNEATENGFTSEITFFTWKFVREHICFLAHRLSFQQLFVVAGCCRCNFFDYPCRPSHSVARRHLNRPQSICMAALLSSFAQSTASDRSGTRCAR